MEKFNNILKIEWKQLYLGTKSAKHPFHKFILSNSNNNQPESRIIILRSVIEDKGVIGFNTDKRSPKYKALVKNNSVSVLFYDEERKIQLRIKGKTYISSETKRRKTWDEMALESRLCYMGKFSPSSTITKYEPNIPLQKITEISNKEYSKGYINFISFEIIIDSIDWLYLNSSGHKRIKFELNDNNIKSYWLAT